MRDKDKTKKQLINELEEARQGITQLEALETERKQIEDEAEEARYYLESIFGTTADGITVVDRKGYLTKVNNAIEKMTGYTQEELIGMHTSELGPQSDQNLKVIPEMITSLKERGVIKNCEVTWFNKDRSVFHVELNSTVLKDRKGNITGAVSVFRDITERKKAEDELRASEEKLAGIIKSVTDCMIMLDEQLNIVWTNDVATQWFRAELVGRKCYAFFHQRNKACEPCIVKKCFKDDKSYEREMEITSSDSKQTDFWSTASVAARYEDGRPRMVLEVLRNTTEKKMLQAEALRTSHLASIGELAAGVAHEINNPTNGIINYAQMLIDQGNGKGEEVEIANRIIQEGERIARIVKNLLSFARNQKEEHSPVSIHKIICDTLTLTETRLRKDGIRIKVDVPTGLPEIMAQSQEIQQVFLNILSNSRYALNQKFPGANKDKVLKIESELIKIEGHNHVHTTFYDRGTGMPASMLDRICNPFFSTKKVGEGTGLGLSISHNIIKSHGGRLWFNSIEGEYTKVMVDLPSNGIG